MTFWRVIKFWFDTPTELALLSTLLLLIGFNSDESSKLCVTAFNSSFAVADLSSSSGFASSSWPSGSFYSSSIGFFSDFSSLALAACSSISPFDEPPSYYSSVIMGLFLSH